MKYVDDIPNPIVEARLSDGYSLKRLGKRLDMSAQYISRAEHGTYSDLNHELIKYVADQLNIPAKAVMHRYIEFQKATRRRTAKNLNPSMLTRGKSLLPGHVLFTTWRGCYWHSPVAFSNAFCVHPEAVNSYEEGLRQSIPDQVLKALSHVKLIDPNWTEKAITIVKQRGEGNADPRHCGDELLMRTPRQRSQEPF